jgi:predicted dehydrogenase
VSGAPAPAGRRVAVAAVGAGGWGRNIVRTLAGVEACELRYVCDLKPDVLATHRRLYPGVRVTDELETILADDEVRAVAVAVDAPQHFRVARACLSAGKHVFVEKPLTLTIADASTLVRMADERGVKLMVGHLLLYHPAVQLIRQLIDHGEIGQVLYLYSQRVNLGVVKQAENAWWSLAPHDISVAQYLLGGRAKAVSVTGQCFLQAREGVEDVVFASIHFDNGTLAHVHASWLDPHKIRKTTIVGSRKMIVFDDMEPTEKVRIYDKGAEVRAEYVDYATSIRLRVGDVHIPAVPQREPLELELAHFIRAATEDVPIPSDGRNGLDVVRVLVAGQRSLKRRGALVQIPDGDGART